MSEKHLKIKIVNPAGHEYYQRDQMNYDSDSGFDLYVLEDTTIILGETKKIDLGIQCEMNRAGRSGARDGLPFYLYPRSSFSKTPLILANHVGIIDAGYRGTITVFVDNIKNTSYTVERGTRLFQICSPDLSPITFSLKDILSETSRGSGGFGSTNTPRNIISNLPHSNNPEPESIPTV